MHSVKQMVTSDCLCVVYLRGDWKEMWKLSVHRRDTDESGGGGGEGQQRLAEADSPKVAIPS